MFAAVVEEAATLASLDLVRRHDRHLGAGPRGALIYFGVAHRFVVCPDEALHRPACANVRRCTSAR